jgi:hypothetical protein
MTVSVCSVIMCRILEYRRIVAERHADQPKPARVFDKSRSAITASMPGAGRSVITNRGNESAYQNLAFQDLVCNLQTSLYRRSNAR